MALRTDLALETAQAVTENFKNPVEGIKQKEFKSSDFVVTEIIIENEKGSQAIGKPIGQYVTIEYDGYGGLDSFPDNLEEEVDAVSKEISRLCTAHNNALIIGLGNNDITPDALGPMVAKQIFATRHIPINMKGFEEFAHLKSVAAVATGVLGQTGIETGEITKAICDKIKPEIVIVVDALACKEVSRLGNTIQISDTGICPGSGVKNSRKELSRATLGVPVISLGVPTVVDMHTVAEDVFGQKTPNEKFKDIMVTPRSIDKLIERTAKLISLSINKCFQQTMSIEEITSLI